MKIRKTFLAKGYTIIELMITLTIFGIVALFAVPAFSTFIEKSRAKTQIIQAANFLRSAQEIAIASNRTVYVFTEGLLTFAQNQKSPQRADYWTQDWVMAFKPIGKQNISMAAQINTIINSMGDDNNNYIIAKQRIFTRSNTYVLSIIDSANHNNVLRNNLDASAVNDSTNILEMEGYSKVRIKENTPAPIAQGFFSGAPTFIAFYPSGEASLPIFVISKRTELREGIAKIIETGPTPFVYDQAFHGPPVNGRQANSAEEWVRIRQNLDTPIALLAGCRMGRGLSVDAIAYTFNPEIIQTGYIFESLAIDTATAFGIGNFSGTSPTYSAAPSFGDFLCGSAFLK